MSITDALHRWMGPLLILSGLLLLLLSNTNFLPSLVKLKSFKAYINHSSNERLELKDDDDAWWAWYIIFGEDHRTRWMRLQLECEEKRRQERKPHPSLHSAKQVVDNP